MAIMGTDPAIDVVDLQKSYGELKAVNGLSFQVKQGEVYSLLGPNGAGKTTTVEILEGIRKADAGKVSVLGVDPWHHSSDLRKTVGIMPQDFRFMERITPREAIAYFSSLFEMPDRTTELIELVELEASKDVYFQNLSGGQKQKVGICLALVNDPQLIFLDEPTTGLDPQARRKIWELIRKLKTENRTVILTTHYLEEAQILADRVGIVDHGKMIVEGSPEQIIRRMGKGRRLHLKNSDRLTTHLQDNLGLEFTVKGDDVSIGVRNNNDVINVLRYAEENGIELTNLSLQEDTLEDIFVDLIEKENE
ncbi:Trehalose/maltose import ATP-binding protein MalK [Thermoplasmatales archaeon]|nr:Trehalose/maltose import ATP-binding protein MalK [Thermoplasmatales archaeon]